MIRTLLAALAAAGLIATHAEAADESARTPRAGPGTHTLATLAALERGESVATVSADLMPLFRPSVQSFLRSELAIDPAKELHELTLPILSVSGGRDLQVGAPDTAALSQARPDAARFHVADMNHVLKIATADPAGQATARTDPSVPLAVGVVDAMVSFVRSAMQMTAKK